MSYVFEQALEHLFFRSEHLEQIMLLYWLKDTMQKQGEFLGLLPF